MLRWSSRYGRQQHDWRNPGSRQGTPENNDKSEGEIDDDEIEKERSPSIEILPRVQVIKVCYFGGGGDRTTDRIFNNSYIMGLK